MDQNLLPSIRRLEAEMLALRCTMPWLIARVVVLSADPEASLRELHGLASDTLARAGLMGDVEDVAAVRATADKVIDEIFTGIRIERVPDEQAEPR
jgi:hypothetical protein